jgi:metal-dependent amidase/aminoacylase/carboxypeptidase family protein
MLVTEQARPGEEGGFGKVQLWDKGAYEGMDVCLMCVNVANKSSTVSIADSSIYTGVTQPQAHPFPPA